MATAGRVVIYGGKGALGNVCVAYFKSHKWWVGSIDLVANEAADGNILVKSEDEWENQEKLVMSGVEDLLKGEKLDAVICVAGGWAGGNAASKEFVKNADKMWKQSVWSSCIAAAVAAKHLKDGGFLSLPGAQPALDGTPGMMGYGMAKAAVHQLTKSLAKEKSGLPPGAEAVAILPVTLDTPMNRKWMPNADQTKWTSLEHVAELFLKWSQGEERPPNGSLVQLITKDKKTTLVMS